jgi:sugar phosphate isomerase/epimerase
MSDWPVGLSTGCFYQTSIFDCLETIRRGGFSMIEICSTPSHLDYHDTEGVNKAKARIDDLGMEAYSFHAPFAPHIDITALDAERRKQAIQEIVWAAEAAAHLEVRYLIIHPGPEEAYRPPPEEHMRRIRNAANSLNSVAKRCYELGIGLVFENMLPHLMFGHTSDMMWLMGAMDTVRVGACLDTGHAFLSGDIHNVMYKLSGHLQVIHANDNHGQNDDHLPPGAGKIQWENLLRELARTDYRGAFILELMGNQPADVVMEAARRGQRYLRNISRVLDIQRPPAAEAPLPQIEPE